MKRRPPGSGTKRGRSPGSSMAAKCSVSVSGTRTTTASAGRRLRMCGVRRQQRKDGRERHRVVGGEVRLVGLRDLAPREDVDAGVVQPGEELAPEKLVGTVEDLAHPHADALELLLGREAVERLLA